MTDECASSSTEEAEHEGRPIFAPYDSPAGGWGALHAVAKALREQSIVLKGSRSPLSINISLTASIVRTVPGRIPDTRAPLSSAKMGPKRLHSN